ncbi:GntR family transcriptional repressor for pyruvate dehydrogenase complex [Dysgonomonadaceae bacterium PH5-43]|nr:GntR family transcriptional repressor for pyruvate dehydrogenase complex [Dysgonomonadaceae bacterium PH5-43]
MNNLEEKKVRKTPKRKVVKEPTLVETTQQRILEYISKDGYQVNQVLPKENELAESLNVSRVVIREALSRLRVLGFIETKRKKGTILISPQPFSLVELIVNSGALNKESIRDLYELRLMLEIGSADFIFERRNEESMQRLKELVEEEVECTDVERLIEIDIEFHSVLYRMANSVSLSNFQSVLGQIFTLYPKSRDRKKEEVISHYGLYKILETGTADLFRSAMRLHLTYQFENRNNYLEEYYKKTHH